MKTSIDCVPCFVRQTLDAVRMQTDDAVLLASVVRQVLRLVSDMNFEDPPPVMGQAIHRLIRTATARKDPYRRVKQQSNAFALELYPVLKKRVQAAKNSFETAVRLAIAGNIIDFGTSAHVAPDTIKKTVDACYDQPLDARTVARLQEEVHRAERIVYLGDNAGEVVFDRILIEELPVEKVTFVVRGAPVINDATMDDAREAGITDIVAVTHNGSDIPGTHLEKCSESFRRLFYGADLIVAKGQGNFETLSENKENIFFLFKVKCDAVARHTGCGFGDIALIGVQE